MKENIKRYHDIGIEVHFTELDIKNPKQENDKQAEAYENLLKACLEYPNCKNFEMWGFTDKYTWLGSDEHPLIYDGEYQPKPDYYSLLKTLESTAVMAMEKEW